MADPRPPFDPVRGAWVILLALLGLVAVQQGMVFVGCAVMAMETVCANWKGENATSLGLEVLTAVAILIGAAKR